MHKPLIIANWKSNKSTALASEWFEQFDLTQVPERIEVAIAPPFTLMSLVSELIADSSLALAGQTVSPFPLGSYTGAIASEQLVEFGVKYVLIGHSERRRYFHETPADLALAVEQALQAGIQPVLCMDEGDVAEQAQALNPDLYARCIYAYEPLGAIGTGNTQSVDEVTRVRHIMLDTFGDVQVIYGGSVSEENVAEFLLVSDGALVATASLDPHSFQRLLTAAGG